MILSVAKYAIVVCSNIPGVKELVTSERKTNNVGGKIKLLV